MHNQYWASVRRFNVLYTYYICTAVEDQDNKQGSTCNPETALDFFSIHIVLLKYGNYGVTLYYVSSSSERGDNSTVVVLIKISTLSQC